MEQLARFKARLATLTELGDIIVAMRALAAAALQESRQALPAVSRYALLIESGISDVAAMLDVAAEPTSEDDTGDTETVCVIGTEHGFVGDLNAELLTGAGLRHTSRLMVVGRRLQNAAAEQDLGITAALPMTIHVAGVPLLARRIADSVGAAARVRVVTAETDSGQATVSTAVRKVLPVRLPAPGERPAPPPLHQLKAHELLAELAGEYLLAEISRALIESLIAENRIRLGVLTAADKNVLDKKEELRRKEWTLRQETITTELLDVVVGAEAVTNSEGR